MKLAKQLIVLAALATLGAFFTGCGDDDGDSGSSLCGDYAADAEAINCLGVLAEDEYAALCQVGVDDGDCGTEYEAMVKCYTENEMTCRSETAGAVQVDACEAAKTAYDDCFMM